MSYSYKPRFVILYRPTRNGDSNETAAANMSVSSPSCTGAQTSFCTVCYCLTMTTHDCASNKPSCASAQALYFGKEGKECWRRSPHAQAQVHELLISHCAQAHKLLCWWRDPQGTRWQQHQQRQWWRRMSTTRPRARAPGIFLSHRTAAATTTIIGNNERRVSDGKASCASTQHILNVKRTFYASNIDATTSQATSNLDPGCVQRTSNKAINW